MQINLSFDAQAEGAPQGFGDAVQAAANILDVTFTDNTTVDLLVRYGENQVSPITGGGAAGDPTGGGSYVFDLFRHAGSGALPFDNGPTPDTAAYFSRDGGSTNVADHGVNSHPSDVLLQMEAVGFDGLVHPTSDFQGAGASDILWRNDDGETTLWRPLPGGAYQFQDFGIIATSWQVEQIADVNGDGKADIVWRDGGTGDVFLWNSVAGASTALGPGVVNFTYQDLGLIPTSWRIEGSGDFTGSGPDSLLWRDDIGDIMLWNVSSSAGSISITPEIIGGVPADWLIAGVGDFNGDGKASILWRNTDGDVLLWNSVPGAGAVSFTYQDLGVIDSSWQIQGVGDFTGDGKDDILWRNTDGDVYLWISAAGPGVGFTDQDLGVVPPQQGWHIQEVGDFNGDGKADILWETNVAPGSPQAIIWSSVAGPGVSFSVEQVDALPGWHVQSDWHGT